MTDNQHMRATEAWLHAVELTTSAQPAQQVAGFLALERLFRNDTFYRERGEAFLRMYETAHEVDAAARPFLERLLAGYEERRW